MKQTIFERLLASRPINKPAALHTSVPVKVVPLAKALRHDQHNVFERTMAELANRPGVSKRARAVLRASADALEWQGNADAQHSRIGRIDLSVWKEGAGFRASYSAAGRQVQSSRTYATMDAAKRVAIEAVRRKQAQKVGTSWRP